MVTREQARQRALECANEMIKKEGGDKVALLSPKVGKCSWTWNEYKQAVVDDKCMLENDGSEIKGLNPVDDMYRYLLYCEERGLPIE